MRRIITLSLVFATLCLAGMAQCNPQSAASGSPCSQQTPASPFFSCPDNNPNGVTLTSPTNSQNISSFTGSNQAGCCLTTPNPAWFYFQINNPGTLTIHIEQQNNSGSGLDVDFVCWGPFTASGQNDFTNKLCCGQYNISDETIVDCSFSTASTEDCSLGTVQSGKWYLLLITNYSNQEGTIRIKPTANSTATTNCNLISTNDNAGTSNSPVCEGETLLLTCTDPEEGATYNWTGPNGFSQSTTNPTLSIPNATPNMSGTYHMTMSGAAQTVNEATLDVIITPSPTPGIVADHQTICIGESVHLSTDGNHPDYTYSWAIMQNGNSSVIANNNQTSIVVYPAESSRYALIAQKDGCTGMEFVDITVNPSPDIEFDIDNSSLCNGESANITATGGTQYQWSTGSTSNTIHVTPTQTTNYSVTVHNEYECTSTATATVTVYAGTAQSTNNGSPCSMQTMANPFCTDDNPYGITYASGVGSHTAAPFFGNSSGSSIGCLGSTPRPAWYYMQIDQPGNLLIYIEQFNTSGTGIDVDFACWGPFTAQNQEDFMEKLCCGQYTFTNSSQGSHRPTNGNHNGNMGGYPDGTMVDCSYYADYTEWCYIPNAQQGQWYILLLTNYNGSAGQITFSPVASASTATTNCSLLNSGDSNSPICEGGTLELYVTSPVSGATYNWTGPNGFSQSTTNPTLQIPNATADMSGEYHMTMTGISQNSNEAVVDVTIYPTPTPEIVADHESICVGESVHLSDGGNHPGYSYKWSAKPLPDGNFSIFASYTSEVDVTPEQSTLYVLIAEANECTGLDSLIVIVNPFPEIKVTIDDPSLCYGRSATITASGGSYYHWSTGSNNSTIRVTPHETTSYTVEVQTEALCSGDTTVEVVVYPEITMSYEVLPSYCGYPSGEITMHATGGVGNFVYTVKEAEFTGNVAGSLSDGTYIITATDSVGCDIRSTVTVPSEQGPVPCFFFTSSDDVNMTITNCTQGNSNIYYWDFGDGVTSTETHPVHEYMDPGRYSVSMIVVDEHNCTDSLRRDYIINGPVYIANAFTPNGDGINDEICLIGKTIQEKEFLWAIFDRHGSLVFITYNPAICWDGTLSNGKDAIPGVYVYRIKYRDVNGNYFERDGNITLIR
ncbi:MAG: gliding motility-associated C-terminal domain-containing protein [Bacteroidales bacterium]|nr:gliding motility-associated C-terminal domain-containing protein [Bacteroidales bacterium]